MSTKKTRVGIGAVAEELGLKPHVLRYWETEFEQLKPRKNKAGNRSYSEADVALLRRIQHLLHVQKYTVEGARRVLDAGPTEAEGKLLELRTFLESLLRKLEPDA